TVSRAVAAALPSVFAFNAGIGPARKEARLRHLRDTWLTPALETGRVRLLSDPAPGRSCAITAFTVDGVAPEQLAHRLRERHNIRIGVINLTEMPSLKGNYLAVDLVNAPQDLARINEAFRSTVAEPG